MASYRIEFTDVAQAEADAAYLRRSQITSPEEALRWYTGIFVAAQSLSALPHRFAPVPDHDLYEGDVRRLLYGRGATAHHLIYRVIEPAEGESEGTVRILHIYHGARRPPDEQQETDGDTTEAQ